jgi:hypothetical protein
MPFTPQKFTQEVDQPTVQTDVEDTHMDVNYAADVSFEMHPRWSYSPFAPSCPQFWVQGILYLGKDSSGSTVSGNC